MPKSNNNSLSPIDYKKPLIFITAGILFLVCFHGLISSRIGFVGYTKNSFYLQDYAYHVILTNHFWFTESGNIYDLDFQLKALSTYMGKPALVTMPVGVTPIALIVWMPFSCIASYSLPLAYSLWITFSLGLLLLVLWKIHAYLAPIKSHQVLPALLCGITFFSLAGVSNIFVGQTSILICAIFSFILYRILRIRPDHDNFSADWLLVILVVVSGMKPPYMIIGFGILLIFGMWRTLFWAAVIVLFLTVMLTFKLGTNWPGAYINMLQMYSNGNFPDIYAWSIVPKTMNIFRSAISGFSGDKTAAISSAVLSGLIFLGIALSSLFHPFRNKVNRPKLVVALIACCLMFAPYSGAYEDMLLIPIFIAVVLTGKTPPLSNFISILIAVALFFSLLHAMPKLSDNRLWIFFILKFIVLAYMIRYAGNNRTGKSASCPTEQGASPNQPENKIA